MADPWKSAEWRKTWPGTPSTSQSSGLCRRHFLELARAEKLANEFLVLSIDLQAMCATALSATHPTREMLAHWFTNSSCQRGADVGSSSCSSSAQEHLLPSQAPSVVIQDHARPPAKAGGSACLQGCLRMFGTCQRYLLKRYSGRTFEPTVLVSCRETKTTRGMGSIKTHGSQVKRLSSSHA